jgi:prolyl oligopeptidase
LQIHDLATGKFIEKIPIKIGSVSSIFARLSRSEVFFAFESILEPPTTYRFDYADKHEQNQIKLELVYQPKIHGYNPDDYRTEQVFYTSKDGTKVPMFITAKKDIKLDNQNPTLLYGYGGFDVSLEPYFSNSRIYWMKSGGVHAVANIRGGGEYGEKWHKAGIREKKQNVFDDFHAAAEFLSKPNGYTKKEKLYIQGGSNGGLLVTACACQRPDLYGAVIGEVGVLDMLRFHKFTIGHAWMGDYGNPDEAEDFEFLRKYSPLHNIHVNPEHQWPAMLLLTVRILCFIT